MFEDRREKALQFTDAALIFSRCRKKLVNVYFLSYPFLISHFLLSAVRLNTSLYMRMSV